MNAMIFAAGLGTRLQPLTNNRPKAMIPFRGKPMLWYAIKNAMGIGAQRVVVNVHHFADQVIDYIQNNNWPVEICISDERDELMDTGGGLLAARHLFIPNTTIFIQNADVLVDCDLEDFKTIHQKRNHAATLLVKKRSTSRYFLFDKEDRLCGWENTQSGAVIQALKCEESRRLGFCGLHLIEPSLLDELGDKRVFSITNGYLELAKSFGIYGYELDNDKQWFDIGTVDKLKDAELNFSKLYNE